MSIMLSCISYRLLMDISIMLSCLSTFDGHMSIKLSCMSYRLLMDIVYHAELLLIKTTVGHMSIMLSCLFGVGKLFWGGRKKSLFV